MNHTSTSMPTTPTHYPQSKIDQPKTLPTYSIAHTSHKMSSISSTNKRNATAKELIDPAQPTSIRQDTK
jgi:hypothetical protein